MEPYCSGIQERQYEHSCYIFIYMDDTSAVRALNSVRNAHNIYVNKTFVFLTFMF